MGITDKLLVIDVPLYEAVQSCEEGQREQDVALRLAVQCGLHPEYPYRVCFFDILCLWRYTQHQYGWNHRVGDFRPRTR